MDPPDTLKPSETTKTLFDKIWDTHVVASKQSGLDLLHVDRSLLTDLSGTLGLEQTKARGRNVMSPKLHLAVPDHMIDTACEGGVSSAEQARWVNSLVDISGEQEIRLLNRAQGSQGIVHVVGLETGFSLPGSTVVCGDSHTTTHGAVGALAWGVGSTEVEHVLATQTLWLKRPKQALVLVEGVVGRGVVSKDIVLYLIRTLGPDFGREHAVEFSGSTVQQMSIEARATLCNMAAELGARYAIIAPDENTYSYLHGLELAPKGSLRQQALLAWRNLRRDVDAHFHRVVTIDIDDVEPQVTWGIALDQAVSVGGNLPMPSERNAGAYEYMGLVGGTAIGDVPIDYVFIGSCTNGRIEDLRAAAAVVQHRKIHPSVTAWVVPGSQRVKRQAESEGLATIFLDAGFEWRHPGCSMCVSTNGDRIPAGKRCVSTSNRNFIGRQGPGARTHLASPLTAAASALTGRITDPRQFLGDEDNQGRRGCCDISTTQRVS